MRVRDRERRRLKRNQIFTCANASDSRGLGLPVEVTAQDVELPLGVANDRVPHNRVMIVVLLIITGVLIIRPHAGEINERSCGRRARLSGGDDTDANENSESGSGKYRNAQKKPTAASSLHRNGAQQADKKCCNESYRDFWRKALLMPKRQGCMRRQLARARPFVRCICALHLGASEEEEIWKRQNPVVL